MRDDADSEAFAAFYQRPVHRQERRAKWVKLQKKAREGMSREATAYHEADIVAARAFSRKGRPSFSSKDGIKYLIG